MIAKPLFPLLLATSPDSSLIYLLISISPLIIRIWINASTDFICGLQLVTQDSGSLRDHFNLIDLHLQTLLPLKSSINHWRPRSHETPCTNYTRVASTNFHCNRPLPHAHRYRKYIERNANLPRRGRNGAFIRSYAGPSCPRIASRKFCVARRAKAIFTRSEKTVDEFVTSNHTSFLL